MYKFSQKQLIEEGFLDGIRAAGSAVRKGLEAIDPEAKKMFAPIDALKGAASGVRGVYKAFTSGDPAIAVAKAFVEDSFVKQGTMLNLKYLSQSKGDTRGRIIPLSQKEIEETDADTEAPNISGGNVESVTEVVDVSVTNRSTTSTPVRGLEDSDQGEATARRYSNGSTATRWTKPIKEADYPFRFVFFEADVDTAVDLFNRETYNVRKLKKRGSSFRREVFGVKIVRAPKNEKNTKGWVVIGLTDEKGNISTPAGDTQKQQKKQQKKQQTPTPSTSLDDEMSLLNVPESKMTQKKLIEQINTLFNKKS